MEQQDLEDLFNEFIDDVTKDPARIDFFTERYADYVRSRFRMNRNGDW